MKQDETFIVILVNNEGDYEVDEGRQSVPPTITTAPNSPEDRVTHSNIHNSEHSTNCITLLVL